MTKYPVSIKWSDEDNGYIATVPGARGLSAFGDSPEEALSQLKIAADAYFESLKKAGGPIPVLEKATSFSGQLRLRLPKSLHAELSQGAESEGVSLNTYLVSLLTREHTKRDLLRGARTIGQAQGIAEKRLKSF
jgi:predicted RNase H-like HicB family nuclease